jgi:acetolactate synthase-1/2/3 large subunit
MRRTGAAEFGPCAGRMIDIGVPAIDWVALSTSLGVEASRAVTTGEFIDQFRSALRHPGPRLIEASIPS